MRVIFVLALVTALAPAQVTATVTTVGQGCPFMAGYPATLSVSQAVIGQQLTAIPAGLPAGEGTLWMSLGPPAAPSPLYPGCFAYLDLSTFAPLTNFITGTAGMGWILINVPNDPSIVGTNVTVQASLTSTWMPAGQPPVVTEAVWAVIGDQY